eukprot:TRINITY_DN3819_c1_g1_i6.p1 TRINITY_DN3819_c1_g1~~TRINITY_DN3819_c1_g1_i6.p1  ORF type:complete len:322 (-),score=55.56 TRINITY_DN3819_c1_g1_i6:218-1183(-)
MEVIAADTPIEDVVVVPSDSKEILGTPSTISTVSTIKQRASDSQQLAVVSVEEESNPGNGDDNPRTPEQELFQAVKSNELAHISAILEKNPFLDWQNPRQNNETALHVATRAGNHVVVALLLGQGAEVHLRDNSHKAPINIALENSDNNMVQLLANKTIASLERSKRAQKENAAKKLPSRAASFRFSEPIVPTLVDSPHHREAEERRASVQRELLAATIGFDRRNSPPTNRHQTVTTGQKPNPTNEPQLSPFHMHFARDSLMSEMMKVSHFQTIRNMFVAVLVIMFINIVVANYVDNGQFIDFSFWTWAFQGFFPEAVCLW